MRLSRRKKKWTKRQVKRSRDRIRKPFYWSKEDWRDFYNTVEISRLYALRS